MSSEETSNIDSDVNPASILTATSPTFNNTAITATVVAARSGEFLENHCRTLEDEIQILKESETKLKQQYADSQRRERILVRRLAVKEQEMQDYASQIAELKTAQAPGPAALRSALLDPAVNILFQKLKAELQSTKAKLEETQNELSAWKFTPDSNTGKRLMAKCRLLYQENEELGKMTSNGRLAKLEGELALQKSYNEEVKKSQLELDDFLQELDEDVEGMQSTIVFLQQELKLAKDTIQELEKEITLIKSASASPTNGDTAMVTHDSPPPPSMFIVNGNNKLNKCSSDEMLNRTHNSTTNHNISNAELRTTPATQFSQLNGGDDLVKQEQIVSCSNNNNNNNNNSKNNSSLSSSNKKLNRNNNNARTNSKKRSYNEDNDDDDVPASESNETLKKELDTSADLDDSTTTNTATATTTTTSTTTGTPTAPAPPTPASEHNKSSDASDLLQQNEQNSVISNKLVNDNNSNKRMTRSIKCKNNLKLMNNNKKLRRSSALPMEGIEDEDEAMEITNGGN